MTAISPRSMLAFVDELQKTSGVLDTLGRAATSTAGILRPALAGRYGRQLLVGAGLGAGGNILQHKVRGDLDQQRGGVLGAGLRGAAAGGAVAGGRILATSEGRKRARQAASNFYERELYGLTGKGRGDAPMDLAKAERVGIVSANPTAQSMLTRGSGSSGLSEIGQHGPIQEMHGPMTPKQSKGLGKLLKQHEASKALFEKGWASAPGGLHGMVTHPLDYAKLRWNSMDAWGKGLTGLGVAGAAHGMLKTPSEEDPNKYKKGLGQMAGMVGGALAPGAGWIGQGLLASGIGSVGKGVGAAADIGVRRLGRVVPHEEQAQWQPTQ